MAIYGPLSAITASREMPLAPGYVFTNEGVALVSVLLASGVHGVQAATGAASEQFLGFGMAATSAIPHLPTTQVKVESALLPPGGAITLSATPLAGSISVFDVTAGAPVASANVALAGSVATITAAAGVGAVGNSIRITYRYTLTVSEAVMTYGDVQPGGYAGNRFGSCGVAQRGVIYTNAFDTSVNWATATAVKTAAGGLVTNQAGTGATLPAVVISIPSVDYPYLGLEFNAV